MFSCWSAAKRTCSQETEPLQSHIIVDEAENFVPPETSGESTSVATPILDEAEDDVQEDPLSILHEQASVQPDPPFADTTESLNRTAEPGPRLRLIGSIVKPSMTSDEAALATAALSPDEKYLLITDPFVPDISYEFPKVNSYGCNRSFQHSWLAKYPWLVYRSDLDGGFCCYCTLFAKNAHLLGVLFRTPFRQWVKVNKILKNHCTISFTWMRQRMPCNLSVP